MVKDIAVLLYYRRDCKYSVYSLVSILESKVRNVDVYLSGEKEFLNTLNMLSTRYKLSLIHI